MALLPGLVLAVATLTAAHAPTILTEVPRKPDPQAHYTFYVHGRILEIQGKDAVSPDFGKYEYDAILRALAATGHIVVSEVRTGDAGAEFVDKTATQVRRLRAAGVPANHIAVVGASKGGMLTLKIARAVAEPEMAFVVLAGCGADSVGFAPELRGRILSLYDSKDRYHPSCRDTFAKARLTASKETVLELGLDHGLLYAPHPEWVQPALSWIDGAR